MGGSLGTGGNLVQWIVETFRIGNLQDAEAEIAWKLQGGVNETSGRTESDGIGHLAFLPYLAGERSLGWHDQARGVFANVSFNTQPVDFLRAGLEAVAFGMADVIDVLSPALSGNLEIVASGNAMVKSAVWIQILADVLGRPILRSPWKEASSRGAAMTALVAGGVAKDLADIPALPHEPVSPNLARHARYTEARARLRELYGKVIENRA
jgi:gluconokinase